jgi:RNA polymerase sigma-70 factor (ECF subfamily)
MSGTDNDAVKSCLDGHPDAYRRLVRRYQAPLLSHLVGRLGDRERAEEAAQETFVRAFFALGKLKRSGSFFPWLLGIATRVVREQRRAERRYRVALRSAPPRAQQVAAERDRALERAMAELPTRYAEVVLLRYYGEMSCAQVAERLELPLGTVTKRLSRAYAMLRRSLRNIECQESRLEVTS